ncbi:MAG TPA: SGNH/GDSL hydrolase family protein [Acetobacteraceae bacterium]|nr:SGNH/GDSL hydrolase family protein [Acetobacteraceae bacterium]
MGDVLKAAVRTALVLVLICAGTAHAGAPCPPAAPGLSLPLPHLRAALGAHRELVIVALGSSSTEGIGASDPAHTYPAILQAALSAALPGAHVSVLNRGIGGQDALAERARIEADAIAPRPQLVIWQAGANAALHHDDPALFRDLIGGGVRELLHAGIDVVLMDNQRSPKLLASGHSAELNQALADTADRAGVGLFSRDRLMAEWERGGEPPAGFVAADALHLNDRGYACVAEALAREIAASLKAGAGVAAR